MDHPHASPPDPPVEPEVVRRGPVPSEGAAVAGTPVVYVPQAGSRLRRWFSWLGWVACLICLSVLMGVYARHREYFGTNDGVQERYHSRSKSARDKIAIIDVSGVISSGEGATKKQIDRVRDDPNVKAIVLRVDSPGGTITGSDYIYHHLCELRKDRELPLVVSMGGIAASGGYYVAMAVGDQPRSIFAEPTTTTGSIGVIVPHYDLSGLLERLEIKDDSIVSHPRKQLLSMTKPLSADDRQVLEGYMQDAFGRFKEIVKRGRPAFRDNDPALEALATGEIFTATQAQRHGLIDEIGFVEQAVDRAAELAGLDPEKTRVVDFRTPLTLWDVLATARSSELRSRNWESLLELGVPRAYYLMTSLPALAVCP